MSFLKRLFGRMEKEVVQETPAFVKKIKIESEWQDIPGYLPAEEWEYRLVSLIATAIAAGDQPESQFVIKKISKRNPEVQLVSVIAASLAAATQPESQFVIKSIKRKNN